jgi:hypothetical protein
MSGSRPNPDSFLAELVASFTRPADTNAYAAGDLVANSTTAGSVVPIRFVRSSIGEGGLMIRKLRMRKSTASLTNASFRLFLFSAAPVPTAGDNANFTTSNLSASNGAANFLGRYDITMDQAFSDGAWGRGGNVQGDDMPLTIPNGQDLHGLLQASAAYAPGSAEVFAFILEAFRWSR